MSYLTDALQALLRRHLARVGGRAQIDRYQCNGRNFNNLRYVDNIVLIATSTSELLYKLIRELLDKLNKASIAAQIEISTSKAKVMTTVTSERLTIE